MQFDALGKYAINLNDGARSGKLDPVIGRDEEIRRVLQILSRRTKNNPILVGSPDRLCSALRAAASGGCAMHGAAAPIFCTVNGTFSFRRDEKRMWGWNSWF